MNILDTLESLKRASKSLRTTTLEDRNLVLLYLAEFLKREETKILAANQKDLLLLPKDTALAFVDRLTLTPARLSAIQESLKQVAALPDPLGEIVETRTLKNNLLTRRVRSPIGVIFMIFESRPNVAIEAFSLALKSGNAILLRGGKESVHTTEIFYSLMARALSDAKLDPKSAQGITDPDRMIILRLLNEPKWIDVVVPRGGDKLIEFVVENSKIPIIKNDRGMCHVYVHTDAKPEMAVSIIENAKKQRPGVCNSMETLLIHHSIAKNLLPKIYLSLSKAPHPVEWYACEITQGILFGCPNVHPATSKNFDTEYLDYKINCRVVKDENEAIDHIELHGSRHSESILTENETLARRFQNEVDAAAVYWNASTRFTDGFELGLGGELGISTQKLHVRGPIGLRELTSIRWMMDGNGQVRH